MKRFNEILKAIAKQNNTTPQEVLKDMQTAIDTGYDNPDPAVQAKWSTIPHKGERPTAEEVINHLALSLASSNHKAN